MIGTVQHVLDNSQVIAEELKDLKLSVTLQDVKDSLYGDGLLLFEMWAHRDT